MNDNNQLLELFQQQQTQQLEFNKKIVEALSNPPQEIKKAREDTDEIENIKPMYLNPNAKFKVPLMFRFQRDNMRYYFDIESDKVNFYPSVTSVISKTTPTSEGLKNIMMKYGEDYWQFMREKAHYGTFLHTQIAEYLIHKNYNFDTISAKVEKYNEEHYINFDNSNWKFEAKKDIASFIKFVIDHEVEPIAIELVVKYKSKDGETYAGAIDLICEMNVEEKGFFGEVYKTGEKKGEPKETKEVRRITAIVDFKSGKSGFFENHEEQLHMYKFAAEQSLDIRIDKVFNVAPNDWKGDIPTFKIKDQTESITKLKIPYHLKLFYLDYAGPKDVLVISGTKNGHDDLSEIVRKIPASDYVKLLPKVKSFMEKENDKRTTENTTAKM